MTDLVVVPGDPHARLARFGYWAFYAGFILGALFVGAADLLDWPWWVSAAIGFGTPFTARRLMNRLADYAATRRPGRMDP